MEILANYPTITFQYHEQGNGFVTELAYNQQKTPASIPDDIVNDTVNHGRIKELLSEILLNPQITINQLVKKIGVSRRTITSDLNKLKEEDKTTRIGSDKTGRWAKLKPFNFISLN